MFGRRGMEEEGLEDLMEMLGRGMPGGDFGATKTLKSADLIIAEARTTGKAAEAKHLARSLEGMRERVDQVATEKENAEKEKDEVISGLHNTIREEKEESLKRIRGLNTTIGAVRTGLQSVNKKATKADLLNVIQGALEAINNNGHQA